MRHTYLLEVDSNDEELKDLNVKRLKLGQQLRTPTEVVEFAVKDALNMKLINTVTLAEATPVWMSPIEEEAHLLK